MIESKFSEFFRSPLGVLSVIGVIFVAGVLVFLFVARVFRGLIEQAPPVLY
ncbi:MAG: hypothetical protein G01um101438_534 [Parcubacteria group bacterium Gr01-1014_38]|nr:MAG: hypothetical protein G01um101438_534 [Parcubacteria group bacterium Gr01-1014_38]